MPPGRSAAAALVAAALALVLVATAQAARSRHHAPHLRGSVLSPPLEPDDFTLRDQAGRAVRLSNQRGKLVVVTFLYTHCPDVCPLIAGQLNQALAELGKRARDVRVLAISVDPKGDTRAAVRRFVRQHHLLPQFRYLTGTHAQLVPIWRAYHLAVNPAKLDTIDHSAYELLIDKEGKGRAIYDSQVAARDVAHDLRALD